MKIGVLGAGQLGQMLALAGIPLGITFRFFDPTPESPASLLAEQIVGDYNDWETLKRFADGLDAITYEFENVPVETARFLAQFVPVRPSVEALEWAQERWLEKSFFQSCRIPTPLFAKVDSRDELETAIEDIGLPVVLKTRRMGYDGKGQYVLREPADVELAWSELGGQELILEDFVSFDRELSILAVRGDDGAEAFYSLVENHHREGILRLSIAPAPDVAPEMQKKAEEYARQILTATNYVGVLAIEFFERNGELIANEMAPRVHNSGHWTIEGAETSQFENHVRAVAGLPLGSCQVRQPSAMVNIIGESSSVEAVLRLERAHWHWYGKAPRPGRKLGHITVLADTYPELREAIPRIQSLLP